MSREIKFRAWDKVENKYVGFGKKFTKQFLEHILPQICNAVDGIFKLKGTFFHGRELDLVYQQYTGLLDKNGVEIYEGDILKTIGFYQELFIVDYSDRSFELYDGGDGVLSDEHNNWEDYEVIGNIYENPELLEEK